VKHFTILELAADWHELMIPQRTMRPLSSSRQIKFFFTFLHFFLQSVVMFLHNFIKLSAAFHELSC